MYFSSDLYNENWNDVFVLGTTTLFIVEPPSPPEKKSYDFL